MTPHTPTKAELPPKLLVYHGEICADDDDFTPLELVEVNHGCTPLQAELVRRWNSYEEMRKACQDAEGVLTEPGMMDVDEWKAWSRRTVANLRAILATTKGQP